MADVPAWLLVFQTLAAGGLGLAGSFIVPKSQREARRSDARLAGYSVMREKAELIFLQIASGRSRVTDSLAASVPLITMNDEDDQGIVDVTGLGVLNEMAGLIATYYPDGLVILDKGRTELANALTPFRDELNENAKRGVGPKSREGRKLRVQMTIVASDKTTKCLFELEAFMLKAVQPFSPLHAAN